VLFEWLWEHTNVLTTTYHQTVSLTIGWPFKIIKNGCFWAIFDNNHHHQTVSFVYYDLSKTIKKGCFCIKRTLETSTQTIIKIIENIENRSFFDHVTYNTRGLPSRGLATSVDMRWSRWVPIQPVVFGCANWNCQYRQIDDHTIILDLFWVNRPSQDSIFCSLWPIKNHQKWPILGLFWHQPPSPDSISYYRMTLQKGVLGLFWVSFEKKTRFGYKRLCLKGTTMVKTPLWVCQKV
jgi:hypothetical protein